MKAKIISDCLITILVVTHTHAMVVAVTEWFYHQPAEMAGSFPSSQAASWPAYAHAQPLESLSQQVEKLVQSRIIQTWRKAK